MANKRKELSNDLRSVIVKLRNEKMLSYSEIENLTGIIPQTAQKIVKKYNIHKSVVNRSGRGRKKIITQKESHLVKWQLIKDRKISAKKAAEEFEKTTGKKVSAKTIKRIGKENEYNQRIALKKPYINSRNRKKRIEFANDNLNKDNSYWKRILWSDESKFNLFGSDGKIKVWRRVGEELKDECLQPTVKYGGGNVKVWGCMSSNGTGNLVFIDDTMDRFLYVDILKNNLKQSVKKLKLGRNFIFQQDNDPKHTSKLARQFFKDNKTEVLGWPSQSPDLNVIEPLWAFVEKNIRKYHISNKDQLKNAILDVWQNIPPSLTKKLVESVPRRITAVLQNSGGPTKY
jgi:transposase